MVHRAGLDHHLAQRRRHGEVAADARLVVLRGELHAGTAEHVRRRLRVREPFQSALAQRIERDDAAAPFGCAAQFAEHARMVRAGILAEDEDRLREFEILQRHRTLAAAELFGERHAGRFVAHVRTVGQVVGAVFAHEQLVQERRLVRRAAGGVEDRFVGRGQVVQRTRDRVECFVPRDREITVALRVVRHRFGEAALRLEEAVVLFVQPRDGVFGEELRGDALGGRFVRDGLDAVLAEFESRMRVAVGPCAAGAIEAPRLVRAQQRVRALHDDLLVAQRLPGTAQRIPAAGGLYVEFDGLLV